MNQQRPNPSETPEQPAENLLSPSSIARDLASGVGETVGDLLYTAGLYLSAALAVVLPLGALVVGGLFVWRAVLTGKSKFVPICVMVIATIIWIVSGSPLGWLSLLF